LGLGLQGAKTITHKKIKGLNMAESQKWFFLIIALIIGILIYLLGPVLTPFMLAALFAYMGDPLVDWLEEKRLSRTLAVTSVFITIILVVTLAMFLIIPAAQGQIQIVVGKMPVYQQWIAEVGLPWLVNFTGIETLDVAEVKSMLIQNVKSTSEIAGQLFSHISASSVGIIAWIGNLVLVPVVTFYLLRDWDFLVERIRELIPRNVEPLVSELTVQCDQVLGAFMRGQLMVMLALGIIYAVGLGAIGLDLALLLGMVAGLASIVPYLGFIIGILVSSVAALMQFQDMSVLFYVAIVFTIGQLIEGFLLTPMLVGDRIGLHPVAVIFSIMAGGQLFGFAGVLLALPVAAVIMVLLRFAHLRYIGSNVYGKLVEKLEE
jgi:predicted PurR-regulated permease PerM